MVSNYKLEEITSVQELRGNVSKLFKLHSELKHPGVRAAPLSTYDDDRRAVVAWRVAAAEQSALLPS